MLMIQLYYIFVTTQIKNNIYVTNTQTFIFIIVLAAFISGVSFFFLITGNNLDNTNVAATLFQKQSISTNIEDSVGDTKLVALYKTSIVPEVKD
jgi:hypothetical protein